MDGPKSIRTYIEGQSISKLIKSLNKLVLYQEQIRFSHLNFLKIAQLTMRYESIPHRGRIAFKKVKVNIK